VDLELIMAEVKNTLNDELNYRKESQNIDYVARLFADDPDIIIPRVFHDFSTEKILDIS
jgi:predicted unusual protein kinase regulating ubiquinone biosynthesis (AarF/ABC1/UbiB family)